MSNSPRPGSPLDLYKMCAASAPEYLTSSTPPGLGRRWEAQRGSRKRGHGDTGGGGGPFSSPSSPCGHLNMGGCAGLPDPQPCLCGAGWLPSLGDTLVWAGTSIPSLFRSSFGSTGVGLSMGMLLHPCPCLCWEPGLCQIHPWGQGGSLRVPGGNGNTSGTAIHPGNPVLERLQFPTAGLAFGTACGTCVPCSPCPTATPDATSRGTPQCPTVPCDAPRGTLHAGLPCSAAPHCCAASCPLPGAWCVPVPGVPAELRPQQGSAARIHPAGLIPSNAPARHEINSREGAVITFHLPLHKYVEIKAAHSAEPTNTRW